MRLTSISVLACLALAGCSVGTLVDVATAPVRVASKAVDLTTTSQSEADQKRGADLRRLEERYGKLEREYRKEDQRCAEGRSESCGKRDAIGREMAAVRQQLPAQPE